METSIKSKYIVIDKSNNIYLSEISFTFKPSWEIALVDGEIIFHDNCIEIKGDRIGYIFNEEKRFVEDMVEKEQPRGFDKVRYGYKNISDFIKRIKKPYVPTFVWYMTENFTPIRILLSQYSIYFKEQDDD